MNDALKKPRTNQLLTPSGLQFLKHAVYTTDKKANKNLEI